MLHQKKQISVKHCFWLKCILVAVAAFLFFTYVAEGICISGRSMENTLHDGDRAVMDKLSYRFSDPERFDVIVFPSPYDKSESIIKRIIGLPGETVQITGDGKILINGKVLEENYGKETIQDAGTASSLVILGADEYFVLGDNRNHSIDSRWPEIGKIKRNMIIGKAAFCFYSGKICLQKL